VTTPQNQELEQKLKEVRELFADAPEIAKVALENAIRNMTSDVRSAPAGSAGRVGRRQGVVSELSVIAPFTASGAKRLRGVLELLNGNFEGAEKVGTVHDMRFVFLDDDRNLLFATAYDGDWDPYIDDFATKIPDFMDILFSCFEGWPGIRSPEVKDFIASHQVPASAWYVATRGSPSRKLGGWRRWARRWPIPGQDRLITDRTGGSPWWGAPAHCGNRLADEIHAAVLRYRPEPYHGSQAAKPLHISRLASRRRPRLPSGLRSSNVRPHGSDQAQRQQPPHLY
jgi:hypothetical protein